MNISGSLWGNCLNKVNSEYVSLVATSLDFRWCLTYVFVSLFFVFCKSYFSLVATSELHKSLDYRLFATVSDLSILNYRLVIVALGSCFLKSALNVIGLKKCLTLISLGS